MGQPKTLQRQVQDTLKDARREMKAMNREEAIEYLKFTGYLDKSGEVSEPYQSPSWPRKKSAAKKG